ncbi:MAG TPA: hypothetical protein PLD12_01805 [Bacteroidales bacterium]|nr:hypothetical protein [Bacteroidales bacterium]HOK97850.1 hypothetical protein [Bacteroidales bacterium]
MKKLICIQVVSLFLFSVYVKGAVLTVSNNPSAPAQYSTVSAVITAASVGDTIYLLGSNSTYGDITIPKRLTIIGAGYDVLGTDYNLATTVGTVYLDSTLSGPIDGVKLIGLSISTIYYSSGDRGYIDNVAIKRCKINGYIYVSGNYWNIINNIIGGTLDIGNYGNIFIANNVFYQSYLYYSNQSSVYVINNLFLYYTSNQFSSVSNANVYNNIFYANSVAVYNSINNVFNNNISYNTSNYTLPPAGNSGTGNIQQTDPKFVSQATIPAPGSGTIAMVNLKDYDWHLQATSPGKNAGSDGTDIGIYGGSYPWPGFTGMPNLPVIESFYIKNPVLHKDSTLKIYIKAKVQQ